MITKIRDFIGPDNKKNESSRHGADEWAEIRNHIGDSDNDADQHGIWKPQKSH